MLVFLLLVDGVWIWGSARSIALGLDARALEMFQHDEDFHPRKAFLVSPAIQLRRKTMKIGRENNVVLPQEKIDGVAMYLGEIDEALEKGDRPTNRFNTIKKAFGSTEVNLTYYLSWLSDGKIILVSRKTAVKSGLFPVP